MATPNAVFFGDAAGNVYALDFATGKLLWATRADDHPNATITGTPTFYDGRLYVPVSSGEEGARRRAEYECCTFRGSVVALDAATGKKIWQGYMATETPARRRQDQRWPHDFRALRHGHLVRAHNRRS